MLQSRSTEVWVLDRAGKHSVSRSLHGNPCKHTDTHTPSRGIYLTPYCQRWACGGDESMPSQCSPSFYSYGHWLTLFKHNRGALPLAHARALSSPHSIRHCNHIFKTKTSRLGLSMIEVYDIYLTFEHTFVWRGPFDPVGPNEQRRSQSFSACRFQVCECVRRKPGLWWRGRSVPNVTACWGGVDSGGWQC